MPVLGNIPTNGKLIRGGSCAYIRSLRQETGKEGVADKGILVSLVSPLGHGIGKERDIHFIAVFVRSLVGESHDTVQEGISAFLITDQKSFERGPAAVPLHKNPRAFGQSREVVGLYVVLLLIFVISFHIDHFLQIICNNSRIRCCYF